MKVFFSVLPEITFLVGAAFIIIGMIVFMNWQVALIFAGALLMVAAAYLTNVMNVEAE